jgi:hypothetical protein
MILNLTLVWLVEKMNWNKLPKDSFKFCVDMLRTIRFHNYKDYFITWNAVSCTMELPTNYVKWSIIKIKKEWVGSMWPAVPKCPLNDNGSWGFVFLSVRMTDTNEGRWHAERKIQIVTLPSLIILCTLLMWISHSSAVRSCALATLWTGMPTSASYLK